MTMRISTFFVAATAFLWGLIGLFGTLLSRAGVSPLQIVAIRAVFSAVFLALYWLIKDRSILRVRVSDIKFFIGTGLVSFLVFNFFFFTTMQRTGIAVSVTLLYTCPMFVVLMSRVFFKEPLTATKWLALLLTLSGCALVTGIADTPLSELPLAGIFTGLLSGLTFALYSIFSKMALSKYASATVTTYTFLIAAAGILTLVPPSFFASITLQPAKLVPGLALALLCTVLPFLLYTKAVASMEAGRAALITTLEPVVAAVMGYAVFGETLGPIKMTGVLLVAGGVLLTQKPGPSRMLE